MLKCELIIQQVPENCKCFFAFSKKYFRQWSGVCRSGRRSIRSHCIFIRFIRCEKPTAVDLSSCGRLRLSKNCSEQRFRREEFCEGKPSGCPFTYNKAGFQNFFEVLKPARSVAKNFFDTLRECRSISVHSLFALISASRGSRRRSRSRADPCRRRRSTTQRYNLRRARTPRCRAATP